MNLPKRHIINLAFILIGVIFLTKLFFLQVLSDEYKFAAEKNIIQRIVEYPYRGLMYDREGGLLVYNEPVFDLMVLPREIKHLDTLAFCQDFNICSAYFEKDIQKAKKYSFVKPSVFIAGIPHEALAKVQDHLSEYRGFFVTARTIRKYTHAILANSIGYIGEISPHQLALDTCHYYKQGDLIGISGLERNYEAILRGKRGVEYRIVNVRGEEKGKFKNGAFDTLSQPGKNLTLTVDANLQLYGEELMKNKVGSIVAIEPKSGEILAIVSSPSYAPNLLAGRDFSNNFNTLEKDSLAPLFNRPIMAMHPPGSIFKIVQALIALQERVIYPTTTYACNRNLVNCHGHPSPTDLHRAIKYSCNPYFYQVFRRILNQNLSPNIYEDTRIGFAKWYDYVTQFGLGTPLGIDLPNEKGGKIPSEQFYDKVYGRGRWKASTIRSLDIGQGEILVTPLQMANLMATIANRGYYYTPHLIKKIDDQPVLPAELEKYEVAIDSVHFELIAHAMQDAVKGTAPRAFIEDMAICGKTGTAENPHGADHSVFVAFAPREAPQIAIAVYVENAGWGGRAAASIGSLVIEKYLKGTISRPWLQTYVLKGNFFH